MLRIERRLTRVALRLIQRTTESHAIVFVKNRVFTPNLYPRQLRIGAGTPRRSAASSDKTVRIRTGSIPPPSARTARASSRRQSTALHASGMPSREKK
jgi:hypothetical protein